MGTWRNRDGQWAFRSVLKDFTEETLTISVRIVNIELVAACTASQLVELVSVAAQPFAGWMCDGGRHGEFQEIMGNLEHILKNTEGKGREGQFQVKQHPMGFIGSADDIIFSTEPGV